MRSFLLRASACLLFPVCLMAQPAAPAAAPKSALDKATMVDFVRHLYAWGPQINVNVLDAKPSQVPGFKEVTVVASAGQASQQEVFLVSNDGKKIIRGEAFDVTENPFAGDIAKIKTDLQPSFGAPGAPVVMVVYSDFQCSFCKEEAKVLRQQVASAYPEQVRVYFKDFPLEQIHPWARPAAIAGRCIFRQKPTAFWEYHDWIFENQGNVTTENLKDKVMEFAKTKGLEPVQLGGCMYTKATDAEVTKSMTEARALGINSTPTVFVNGRRLVGQVPWPQLKSIIDHELEYSKAHGGGEKCCEVKLDTPGLKK